MFDHVKFGVRDYAASKAFYLQALEPLGVTVGGEGVPSYGIEICGSNDASLCLFETGERTAPLHIAFVGQRPARAPSEVPRELLRGLRHRSGRAQHRGGLPRARLSATRPGHRGDGGAPVGAQNP